MTGAPYFPGEVKARLKALLGDLMLIPGLSGHEGRVRRYLAERACRLSG